MTQVEQAELRRLLVDIVFWGTRVATHIRGVDEVQFRDNPTTCDAVCWAITCVGEAAGAVRRRWPQLANDIDLAQAYAMRNRLSHGYFAIDLGIVWLAAIQSVPAIVAATQRRIEEL